MTSTGGSATRAPSVPRRRLWTIISGVVVLALCALLVVACNPMAIAAWKARPAMQEMLGDRGDVSTHLIERQINVSPRCAFGLEMHSEVTSEAFTDVLARIDDTLGDSTCTVADATFAPFSAVSADDWAGVSDEAWAAIAERVRRNTSTAVHRLDEGWLVSVTTLDGDAIDGARVLRSAMEGEPLERVLDVTRWQFTWRASNDEDGGVHEISVESDGTPPAQLSDALDDVAAIIAPMSAGYTGGDAVASADDPIVGVRVSVIVVDGVASVHFGMSVQDWGDPDLEQHAQEWQNASTAATVAAALIAAVEDSGLETDMVQVEANKTLHWGDLVE